MPTYVADMEESDQFYLNGKEGLLTRKGTFKTRKKRKVKVE